MEEKYFLTVDWCSKGKRGVFCNEEGRCFSKEEEHTKDEIDSILGLFSTILSPKSLKLTEEELKEYNQWRPLAEYSHQFGVAMKKES